jgi:hypothetical protein
LQQAVGAGTHALTLARSRAISPKPPPAVAESLHTSTVAAPAFCRSRAAPVSTPIPAETPVTKIRFPCRLTPTRTSSVVDVAPNTPAIFFRLHRNPKSLRAHSC